MLCKELHAAGCDSEIQASWKFCPLCGRKAGGIRLVSHTLRVPSALALGLEHRGTQSVKCNWQLSDAPSALKLTDKVQQMAAGQQNQRLVFSWDNAQEPQSFTAVLKMRTDCGAPETQNIFETSERIRIADEEIRIDGVVPAPARMIVEPDVAIFHTRCRQRTITVRNTGDAPLRLLPFQAPRGFRFENRNASWLVPPRSSAHWTLVAEDENATESQLQIGSEDGKQSSAVTLFYRDGEAVEKATNYIIGVDFGTSGTSVWLRDMTNAPSMASALSGATTNTRQEARRFPTEIFIRMENGREAKDGFLIGYEATEAAATMRDDDLYVRELKTFLRSDEEPFEDTHGRRYRVGELLCRYLQELHRKVIASALLIEGATVAWHFSVPVLDKHQGGDGQMFEKQRARLEQAIRAAGYVGTGDSLYFFTEPFCAAIYLLQKHGQYRFPAQRQPRDGDWACVFDSGGGTTDVVLGQLQWQEGRLHFDEVSTLGGYRNQNDKIQTFGGEALTNRTAMWLSLAHGYLNKTSYVDQTSAAPRQMIEAANQQGEEAFREEPLWRDNYLLLRECERIKRVVADLPAPASEASLSIVNSQLGNPKINVQRRDFDDAVVDKRLNPLLQEMDKSVFDGDAVPLPTKVQWAFAVGGNSRVRRISEDRLASYFGEGLQNLGDTNSDEDRMLAVSGGTVWAREARRGGIAPYQLWIKPEDAPNTEMVFHIAAHEEYSDATIYKLSTHTVPGGKSVRFVVCGAGTVLVGGEKRAFQGELGSFALENPDPPATRRGISARFSFRGRTLVIESESAGVRTPKWEHVW